VRIDTPAHISAVRQQVKVPMIGLEATVRGYEFTHSPVSPCCGDLRWSRYRHRCHSQNRPGGETVTSMISRIHEELGKPVMADVDTIEAAIAAEAAGADLIATTLYGYTAPTQHLLFPALTSSPSWYNG